MMEPEGRHPGEKTAGEIAKELGEPVQRVMANIQKLVAAGEATRREVRKQVYFTIKE